MGTQLLAQPAVGSQLTANTTAEDRLTEQPDPKDKGGYE